MRFSTNVPMSKNSLKVMYTVVITSLRNDSEEEKKYLVPPIWEEVTAIGLSARQGGCLASFYRRTEKVSCTMSPSPQVALRLFYYTPIVMNCQECFIVFYPYALPRFRLPAPLRGSTPRRVRLYRSPFRPSCRSAQNDTKRSRMVGYNLIVVKVTLVCYLYTVTL